ncbi:hypothetical protein [Methylobacterium sp. Gmos1]
MPRFVKLHAIAALGIWLSAATSAVAQQCKSLPDHCREGGALLHNPTSSGNRIWTVSCRGADAPDHWSNTSPARLDSRCSEISACPAAGGFGKFLRAVSNDCRRKQFDGYFGLDGMTYGILDWTAADLPVVMGAFRQRDRSGYDKLFGALNLPLENGCLRATDVCERNRQGLLMCDRAWNRSFRSALASSEFQKSQAEVALAAYDRRLAKFADLGLTTEYGNTALAVVSNNLRRGAQCRPKTWITACAGIRDETKKVDCMLDRYAAGACRGTKRASLERVKSIKSAFKNTTPGHTVHPTIDAVVGCTDKWGKQS